ncbi:hypothetical protein ColTof4_13186 [Colletotrichum tofieldiae]|nr:hypothetical protein ColTof3_00178 [Colletotrichum tofieldiae]GKT80763.1 hypothetical protein ColTof4_13186 [Colletotrichum tofieldiae]
MAMRVLDGGFWLRTILILGLAMVVMVVRHPGRRRREAEGEARKGGEILDKYMISGTDASTCLAVPMYSSAGKLAASSHAFQLKLLLLRDAPAPAPARAGCR